MEGPTIDCIMLVIEEKRSRMRQVTRDITEEIDRLLLEREVIEAPYRDVIVKEIQRIVELKQGE